MNVHGKPSHLHRSSRRGKLTLRHKLQIAQHTGMRNKAPVKITLPKEPWERDKWEKPQSSQ